MRKKIAIDIGSKNIRAVTADMPEGKTLCEPSVIAVERDDDRKVAACGADALRLVERVKGVYRTVSPFSPDKTPNQAYAAALLGHMIKRCGAKRHDVYLSYSGRKSPENDAIIVNAIQETDVGDVITIDPAYAAGCGCGVRGMGENVIVNIGASYVNMAAYSRSKAVDERVNTYAGNSIDKAISIAIFRKYRLSINPETAENIKLSHASLTESSDLPFVVKCVKPTLGLPFELKLTENEISGFVEGPVDELLDDLIDMVRGMPAEPDKIVLTGGGALLSGLQPTIQSLLHFPVIVADDPANAVIRGIMQIIEANFGDE
ncbi:MAG: rod shape-determining protein [Clostridia bacterium]|nr:rod shape-determining protein [Clostridia bacterium]